MLRPSSLLTSFVPALALARIGCSVVAQDLRRHLDASGASTR